MRLKRRYVVLSAAALAGVAVAVAASIWPSERNVEEPIYEGKPYREWIGDIVAIGFGPELEERQEKAVAAIKAMGTNIVPYLLQEIACKDDSFATDTLIRIVSARRLERVGIVPAPWRRDRAQIGFRILRDHKEFFIDALQKLEKDPELRPTLRPLLSSLERGW